MADSCSSSSEEEHAILLGALAVLQQIYDEEKKEKLKRKRWWVRPRIARRQQCGAFNALVKEIKVDDPRAFAILVRMDAQQIQYLIDAVSPLIVHKDKVMRDAISPSERIAVTLRFFATNMLHNLLCKRHVDVSMI